MKIAKITLTTCPRLPSLLICGDLDIRICRDGLRAVFGHIPTALEIALDPLHNGVRFTNIRRGRRFKSDNGQQLSLNSVQQLAVRKLLGTSRPISQFWIRGCE
jgi:hypothetical protein